MSNLVVSNIEYQGTEAFENWRQSTKLHRLLMEVDKRVAPRVRVAVVGAGLAGLAAANALVAKRGLPLHEVAVLEAQPRIGGRVYTRPFSGALPVKIEVGAAWVHGTRNSVIAQLANELGVELKEVSLRNPWLHPESCDGFALFDGARQLDADQVEHTWRLYALLLERLQELATATGSEKRAYEHKPLAELVEMLVGETEGEAKDDSLRAEVRACADGRARVDFCVRLLEIWMGATADALQLDDFSETDLIGCGGTGLFPASLTLILKSSNTRQKLTVLWYLPQ